jgi:tol-pal system beta propeller repeat protein TolB
MRFKNIVIALTLIAASSAVRAQIDITKTINAPGNTPPIFVSMSGITGEAADVLRFDLYVQGFAFTNAEAAQYLISGTSGANLQGKVVDNITKEVKVPLKAYSGASLRRQAHAFGDDFVQALGRKPIALTKVAFKGESNRRSEIFIADFDGHNAQPVTQDNSIVAGPCCVPGRMAMYYVSYTLNNPTIFYHNLSTGDRKAFAHYNGSNFSPAVSPDGSRVAMILDKDGWTDLYVCNSDGTGLKRLTRSRQDESSPCWSADGQWICYASKDRERRALSKISPAGGEPQRIVTAGVLSPTEPDWSPDNKWIAFTSQGAGFSICVVPATGGTATVLVAGEDPSWSPNSRTLMYGRRQAGRYTLSLLDVPTKQYKDVSRISGISSQSQPSWAR